VGVPSFESSALKKSFISLAKEHCNLPPKDRVSLAKSRDLSFGEVSQMQSAFE